MDYEYEGIVELKIISKSLPPEKITEIIGTSCNESWHIGDNRPYTTIKHLDHGWILGSGLPKSMDIRDQLTIFLPRLIPYADKLQLLAVDNTVDLSCVIYSSSPPGLYFNKTIISSIAQLGVNFDIDLYILRKS